MSNPAAVISALQTLTQSALTITQIVDLLNMPERTEADVQAQLDATDAAIQKAREDN